MDFTLNNLLKTSLNWLIPRKCISCDEHHAQENHPCCARCYEALPFQPHCCQQCGQVFSGLTDYCGRCITKPPPFERCFCPFQYETPIREQIRAFKYNNRPELAKPLAQLLLTEIDANKLEYPELLIPVPMHISKLRSRGYNQSTLLAKQLSKLMGIPYQYNIIKKRRKTKAQVQLTLKQRQKNLHNSTHVCRPIQAKRVAIIDDVFTTGATTAEMAKTLKRNGVDYCQVWGIAHTI